MKVQLAVYSAGRAGPRQFIKSISQMCISSHCTHGVESRNVGLIDYAFCYGYNYVWIGG